MSALPHYISTISPLRRILLPAAVLCLALASGHADPYFGYSALPNDAGLSHHTFSSSVRPSAAPVRRAVAVAMMNTNQGPIIPVARPVRPQAEEPADDLPVVQSGAGPIVGGSRAVVHHGIAYAPANAPDSVKRAIWAINSISRKPYHWGGGHGSFSDCGYDCSGSVSFALHGAGVLSSPLDSRSFMSYGQPGHGRWVTVYARNGHTFANIAGLRLDTTDFRGRDEGPRWRTDGRSPWGFTPRHPAGL